MMRRIKATDRENEGSTLRAFRGHNAFVNPHLDRSLPFFQHS